MRHPLADPVTLAVGGLAVHRLTRLVTDDRLTEHLRQPIVDRGGWAGYLIVCPWCVSPYLAAAWATLTVTAPRAARAAGAVLAWSTVAGLLAEV